MHTYIHTYNVKKTVECAIYHNTNNKTDKVRKPKMEASFCNHWSSGKAIRITHSGSVFVA